jgi:hypothetical protein
MNPWIKYGIVGLVSFGGGVATGIFLERKKNNVQFEIVTEEEMAELERQDQAKKDIPKEEKLPDLSDVPANDVDKTRLALQGKKSYIEADAEAKARVAEGWNAINEYSNEENANNMPVEIEEGFDPGFIEEIKDEGKDIYPIDMGAFYNERKEYNKVTIDWYEADKNDIGDTWMDENEEIIADPQTYIGDIDIRELFKDTEMNEDPDVRFVRNEGYESDYEIIRHHRSWKETTGEE